MQVLRRERLPQPAARLLPLQWRYDFAGYPEGYVRGTDYQFYATCSNYFVRLNGTRAAAIVWAKALDAWVAHWALD